MNSWETRTRDFFVQWSGSRYTTAFHTLNALEARIGIFGEGEILNVEASLPKLLHGNNLMTVTDPREALDRLRAFVSTHVDGDIPDFGQMEYQRVDFCHNFQVGSALADYVHTLGKVSFLKHRRTTDECGGVEWWSDNGRRIRVYDKYKEILEHDKKAVAEALGILRFEIQIRRKSGFLQRLLGKKKLTLRDVLKPEIAYRCLVEFLDKMSLSVDFQAQDAVRNILDEKFSFRKATRLLGILWRLESGPMEDLKQAASRSTYYSDKRELRLLGLWPPSAGPNSLPALVMPPLETILSADVTVCESINKREGNTNAIVA